MPRQRILRDGRSRNGRTDRRLQKIKTGSCIILGDTIRDRIPRGDGLERDAVEKEKEY